MWRSIHDYWKHSLKVSVSRLGHIIVIWWHELYRPWLPLNRRAARLSPSSTTRQTLVRLHSFASIVRLLSSYPTCLEHSRSSRVHETAGALEFQTSTFVWTTTTQIECCRPRLLLTSAFDDTHHIEHLHITSANLRIAGHSLKTAIHNSAPKSHKMR